MRIKVSKGYILWFLWFNWILQGILITVAFAKSGEELSTIVGFDSNNDYLPIISESNYQSNYYNIADELIRLGSDAQQKSHWSNLYSTEALVLSGLVTEREGLAFLEAKVNNGVVASFEQGKSQLDNSSKSDHILSYQHKGDNQESSSHQLNNSAKSNRTIFKQEHGQLDNSSKSDHVLSGQNKSNNQDPNPQQILEKQVEVLPRYRNLVQQLQQQALQQQLAQHWQWKGLLHIQDSRSIIRDPKFFYAADGYRNPEAELLATIAALFADPNLGDQHARCRFPGRWELLKSQLHLSETLLPQVNCPALREHMRKMAPETVTIVFVTEKLGSLASMMGHLFLKISGNRDGRTVEHAFNYFANFGKNSAWKFYWGALFGDTPGIYLLTPYRQKLAEYRLQAGRSVWEYELDLSVAQAQQLVYHLWELKDIDVPYNFTLHNCGTASLRMLTPVDLRFDDFYRKIWMSPLDTIQKMDRLQLIRKVTLLPSTRYQINSLMSNLTLKQRQTSRALSRGVISEDYQQSDASSRAKMVQLAKLLVNYRIERQQKVSSLDRQQLKQLQQRQQELPEARLSMAIANPTGSASSSSIQVATGRYKEHAAVRLSLHPVYHHLNDYLPAEMADFQLQLLHLDLVQDFKKQRLYIENLTLLQLTTYTPTSYLLPLWSGGVKFGASSSLETDSNRLFPVLEMGIGKTYALSWNRLTVSGVLYAGWVEKSYLAPEITLIWRLGKRSKMTVLYRYDWHGRDWEQQQFKLQQNLYLTPNRAIGLQYQYVETPQQRHYANLSLSYTVNF